MYIHILTAANEELPGKAGNSGEKVMIDRPVPRNYMGSVEVKWKFHRL